MNPTTLQLPRRDTKPRSAGITMVVDGGLPTRYFEDVVSSGAEYLDFVKFGWGTAIVTKDLREKIAILNNAGVDYYFGGTLFEKYVLQDRLDAFRDLCHEYSCQFVEVSNGTIELSNLEKAGYIRKLSDDFRVISEVGFKDAERSENLPPSLWIECTHEDLDAGRAWSPWKHARAANRASVDLTVSFGSGSSRNCWPVGCAPRTSCSRRRRWSCRTTS